jgi:hypothetical protein
MSAMTDHDRDAPKRSRSSWSLVLLLAPIVYVLSSGPVLAIAFWLREATGWDAFYAVMYLYYPVLMMARGTFVGDYIEWWVVDVFHTVGPG